MFEFDYQNMNTFESVLCLKNGQNLNLDNSWKDICIKWLYWLLNSRIFSCIWAQPVGWAMIFLIFWVHRNGFSAGELWAMLLHFFVSKLIAFDHQVISENDFGNSFSPLQPSIHEAKEKSHFRRSLISINYRKFLILLFSFLRSPN